MIITIDTDWASDSILKYTYDIIKKYKVRSKWFVTNDSPFVEKYLKKDSYVELGIHPNFNKGSSHGDSFEQVILHCKKIVPDAFEMRSHRLMISNDILRFASLSGIINDYSLSMHLVPDIKADNMIYFFDAPPMCLIPTYFQDCMEFYKRNNMFLEENKVYRENVFTRGNGLRVFDFHPIHIAFNSNSLTQYELMKQEYGCDIELSDITPNNKYGAKDMFEELCKVVKDESQGL